MVKICKWWKLYNSVPLINRTLVNHIYIRIWSFWLTYTVLLWMKKNCRISQFASFLLRSLYVIYVKICKWLKLLNSVPFIKKTLVNHLYLNLIIFTDFQSYTVNGDKLQNQSIWRFLIRSVYAIFVQICKRLKTYNSVPFIKKTLFESCLHSNLIILTDFDYLNLIILTDFHSFTVNEI